MFLPANITLQFGDSGDFVAELQRRLSTIDAHPGDGVSGFYDGVTVNSVSSFQSRVGIRADGIAGPETLRRLNGVMSGDNGSTDDKKEEEEKQLADEQHARDMFYMDQQNANLHTPIMAVDAAAEAVETAAQEAHTLHGAPHEPGLDVQQQIRQQNQFDAQLNHTQQAHVQHPPQMSTGEMLAQMLMQQQAAHPGTAQHQAPDPQHAPAQHGAQQHTHERAAPQQTPQLQHAVPAPEPQLATQQQHAPQPQHAAPQAHHAHAAAPVIAVAAAAPAVAPPVIAAAPAPAAAVPAVVEQAPVEQAKGLVGRAMQKMDAFMQRLSDHFETKLPPHVIQQVREAGQTMLASGVKEVGIPSGPEAAPALSTPGRGAEHQQATQRG